MIQDDLFGPRSIPEAEFATFADIFLRAVAIPLQGMLFNLPARNAYVITMFGERDTLTVRDLFQHVVESLDPSLGPAKEAARLGTIMAQAVGRGIVARDGDAHEPTWRLLDRRPRFMKIGREYLQVRGLSPDRQAVMDRRVAALETRRMRADRRHAVRIGPRLLALLTWLARSDDAIPPTWRAYVPADVMERWPRLRDAFGLLADVHADWPRQRQCEWLAVVEATIPHAVLAEIRDGVTPTVRSDEPIPDEDLAALDSLDRCGPQP